VFQCKAMHSARRRFAFLLGCLPAAAARAQAEKHGTTIHQESDFKAPPVRIYEALLDPKRFAAFTHDTAQMDAREGGVFKLFGGRIEGRNIELVPSQRIVQAWRPSYWDAGVYSIVKFELVPRNSGTRVVLDHAGFTEAEWQGLNEGWTSHYWEPLHKYLNA
jgi:activator of HSP90 ATPase